MGEKLVVFERHYEFQIGWEIDGDEGAMLGETLYKKNDLKTCSSEDWDHVMATIVASETDGVSRSRGDYTSGFVWESKRQAVDALRVIKIALKNKSTKPWPDWALKAKAAGWKPPKTWTP